MGECWRAVRNSAVLIAGLLAAWQAPYAFAGPNALTPPIGTFRYAGTLLSTGSFWAHVEETRRAFLVALAIAVASGLLGGFVLGLRRLSGEIADPVPVALYSIPKIALYPIVLLICGIGLPAKIAFGAIHGVIPAMIFTMSAVRTVEPVLLKTARVLKLGPMKTIAAVVLPAALPEIFTGIRIGFSLTLIGTLLGGMSGSQRGLGFLLMTAIGLQNIDVIMAVTLLLILFAATVSTVLIVIDHRLHRRV